MSGSSSLKIISKALNIDKSTTLNTGIGGYYKIIDTGTRPYPSKHYTSITTESDSFLNGKSCKNIIFTLNNDNIDYGSGSYSIFYTPYINNSLNNPYRLFDFDITDSTTNSAFFGNKYDLSTGNYTGTNYLVESTYKGEWLAIKLEVPIKLSNYKIYRLSNFPSRSPKSFKVYASSDGISWTIIDTVSNLSSSEYINNIYTKSINISNYYYYYAININAVYANNETYCNFIEWVLNAIEGVNTYIPVYGYDNNNGNYSYNAKLTVTNNPLSWKTAIFKNINSDYVSIGLYDLNNNSNPYIGAIDKNSDVFKDLYINNLGISSQPANLIGNVIINGKTTIGNSSNSVDNNFLIDIYSKSNNDLALFRNSNTYLSFSVLNNSNFTMNTSTNQIYINPNIHTTRIFTNDIIIGSNNIPDTKLLINGNSIFNGTIIIGNNSNVLSNTSNYSLFVQSNVYFNSNLYVGGIINGDASGLSNISLSALNFNNSTTNKIGANIIDIASDSAIAVNNNNQLFFNYDDTKLQINNDNKLTIIDSAIQTNPTFWLSADPDAEPVDVQKVYFNQGTSYVGINNDNPKSCLFVGLNGNLMRLATANVNDSYFSQIGTVDVVNNSNHTKIKLIAPVDQSTIISSNNYDISGSIYYNITGTNPSHIFNYESNGIQSPLMVINKQGTIFIGSSNNTNIYQATNNEKLLIEGNVLINNSNINNPSSLIIGNSNTNNCYLQTFGNVIIGTSNADTNQYSFYVNSNAKFNSNLTINCNLNVNSNLIIGCNLNIAGIIGGNGYNLSNLKVSSLVLDGIYNSNKLDANYLRVNSNTGLNVSNANLFLNYDNTKFLINSNNQLTLSNSAVPSFWLSAQPDEEDPTLVSKIYFNKSVSYVGVNNDDPKSSLFVGLKGHLLRVAATNVNDSYFSQIGTVDVINNSNHTKIKLIAPVDQSTIVSSNSYDISGSIYYNITGINPSHIFNYETNGIQSPLMVINKQGTVFIGSSNNTNIYQATNNEKLLIEGNVLINNSNINNPSSLIIGNSNTNNCYLQTFGNVIIGTSNVDTNQYSFYVNNNAKFNSNLTINCNLNINGIINAYSNLNLSCNLNVAGIIGGNGYNLSNLKVSSLVLDGIYNSNKLDANYLRINSNTGLNVSNANLFLNYDNTKFLINSNNQLTLSNSAVPSFWLSAQPDEQDPTLVSKIYFNKSVSYVGVNNDNPKSCLFVGLNGNLLRVAATNVNDSYFSQIGTVDVVNNSNHTKIKLIAPVDQSTIVSSNSYDISGSIYYNITGINPSHIFNYETNGIQSPLMVINKQGTVFIGSSNNTNIYQATNNEKLLIEGNVLINNSNINKPSSLIIGNSNTNNCYLQTFGNVIIGTSNADTNQYSFYVNSNAKFNSNLTINCNLNVNNNLTIGYNLNVVGIIGGNGYNLSNLKVSSLVLDGIYNSNKLDANYLRINSNSGLNVSNANLFLNYDNTKFLINSSNQLSLSNSAVPSFWLSAQPDITDPTLVSKIYFNKSVSYVGVNNDNPKSCLFVGLNGNLLRVAATNVNDSYFSQIGTVDVVNNSNHTKIKLIAPVDQSTIVSSNSYDISGSIYYNITGTNPSHIFNYETNGIQSPLMVINKQGTVFIGSSNNTNIYQATNNEKLLIEGNVLINNSNINKPSSLIIGNSNTNNCYLQTFGNVIIGTSNADTNQYSFYANNNAKFNSNLIINSNLTIGCNLNVVGIIGGNGYNLSNLKVSSLVLDGIYNSNKLDANYLRINSNSGLNISNANLFLNYDNTKFLINSSNQLSLSNSAVPSFWLSAQPDITDPTLVSKIYFNKSVSYIGVNNDNPKSCLFVGLNGNLLRVAATNVNDSYFSQIGTVDVVNNSNHTKIKLIAPIDQSTIVSSNSYDISGSIYYNITGTNPTHTFNYESNGIQTPLMIINRQKSVIIGDNVNNNSILQTFGSVIIGTSNADANQYSLYVNSNVKINSNSATFINTVTIGQSATPALNLSGYQLNINGNMGLTGNIFTISDETLKTNVKTYDNALDRIINCRGVTFNYINNFDKINIGVIAQEIEKIIPEVVETNNGIKNVNYLALIGVLIEAIKELNKKIDIKI